MPASFWAFLFPKIGDAIDYLKYTGDGQTWLAHMNAHMLEEEHREMVGWVAPHAAQRVAQSINKQRAVGQPGQVIVQGIVDELLLELATIRDIGLRSGHAHCAP